LKYIKKLCKPVIISFVFSETEIFLHICLICHLLRKTITKHKSCWSAGRPNTNGKTDRETNQLNDQRQMIDRRTETDKQTQRQTDKQTQRQTD
jgi:hypothetical protein